MTIMPSKNEKLFIDVTCCLAFFVYASTAIIIPICLIEMSKDLNFHLTGGGSLKFIDAVLGLLVLIISGRLAAYFGKSKLLYLGSWIMTLGLLLFSFSYNFWTAMGCCVIIGGGSGLLEALLNPLVQDVHPKTSSKALNLTNAFYPLGTLLASLFIGEFLTLGYSWRIIFRLTAVGTAAVGAMFFISQKIKLPKSYATMHHVANILKRPRFWCFGVAMFFVGMSESAFVYWSATFIRLKFLDEPRLGAISTALFAGSMVLARIIISNFVLKVSLRNLILVSATSSFFVSLLFPFSTSISMFYFIVILAGISMACFWPTIQSFAVNELPVDPTLLFIFLSCCGIPGYGFSGIVMGVVGDIYGLTTAFLIIPSFFIFIIIAILIEQKCAIRR
jgi:fucose permease